MFNKLISNKKEETNKLIQNQLIHINSNKIYQINLKMILNKMIHIESL